MTGTHTRTQSGDSTLFYLCIGIAVAVTALEFSVISIPIQLSLVQQLWNWLSRTFSFWILLVLSVAPYIGYKLFILTCTPLKYHSSLVESAGIPKSLPNRFKNSGKVPPPFPNGWFNVQMSSELKEGQVKHISVLGKEYALYRGEDGVARVLNAFCPHLGANLAVGGIVKDNCLTCPFHGWSFNGDSGQCVSIPYSSTIPSTAHTETVPIAERNGMIFIWHHSAGEKPTWEVPQAEGLNTWRFRCDGFSQHEISAHIQEIPENGADVAHLNVLHTWPVVELLGYLGFAHGWTASWEPGTGENKHIAFIKLVQFFRFLGFRLPLTTLDVSISQIGPGIVVLQFNTAIGRAYIVQSVTPLEPLVQNAVHSVYMPWYIPRIVGRGLLQSVVVQVERDVPIWNNKTYVPKPPLCKGDGKINVFRRWFKQFYTKEALALSKQKNCILDW